MTTFYQSLSISRLLNMAVWDLLLLSLFLHCIQADNVTALECYECSNLAHEGCGETFNIKENKSAYLFPCVGISTMCRKIVHRDNNKGVLIVTRSCWSSMSGTHLPKKSCNDFMDIGEVCYCDEDSCNGQGTLRPTSFVLSMSVPAVIVSYFYRYIV